MVSYHHVKRQKKTNDLIFRKLSDGRTDGGIDRQTDRRTDRQIDRRARVIERNRVFLFRSFSD